MRCLRRIVEPSGLALTGWKDAGGGDETYQPTHPPRLP